MRYQPGVMRPHCPTTVATPDDLFERGYTTRDQGTGFGLDIVREIVAAHGWEIDVRDSEAGGARFEITGVAVADR